MSTFTLKIDCNNAAFVDYDAPTYTSAAPELARILREIATKIEAGQIDFSYYQSIRDINGNDVGRYALK